MKETNAIRTLSIDMIERANSGHPGICMGSAPMMQVLYGQQMKVYAKESNWFNRDRFILAAGHGSAMLYSTLHLSGYNIQMEDLKQFRQLNSKTPGHPEVGHTDGVDATSGPLGQGVAQGVGMAMAERFLAEKYNESELKLIDHYTFVLCGDGDLQEGVSAESSSLAGHLKLNKLIMLWDSNDIQLDDATKIATTENILMRYEAYGWNTLKVEDGNNINELNEAISKAKESDKPTLIEVKTIIGYGSPNKSNSSASHGAPLGKEEVVAVKQNYNWNNKEFEIEQEIYDYYQNNTLISGEKQFKKWEQIVEEYSQKYPAKYEEFKNYMNGAIEKIETLNFEMGHSEASRVSSGKAINNIAQKQKNLIGGSADLSKSNNSLIENEGVFGIDSYVDRNISFGVREFAMGAITNGMYLHGGVRPYCATFFVFSDYLKPAIRMSAIQNIPNIYVLTHDSVAVGEDGPTHEPIEQLSGLRAIPNVNVIRPSDANETQIAWKIALESTKTPTVLVLSRQNLEVITNYNGLEEQVKKGAYIVAEDPNVDKILIATGSEVKLALDSKKILNEKGIGVRVISMPCMSLFDQQTKEYQEEILNAPQVTCNDKFFIEMASAQEGYKYAKNIINIPTFGASGEGSQVIEYFGFTPEEISKKIQN